MIMDISNNEDQVMMRIITHIHHFITHEYKFEKNNTYLMINMIDDEHTVKAIELY